MSPNTSKSPLGSALRRVFPWLGRQRHYASIGKTSSTAPKLEPIAKTVAEAGRTAATPAD